MPYKFGDFAKETLEQLSGRGAFLTVGTDNPNTMTIGWGSLSVYWGKDIFIVPVRESRYSYGIIDKTEEFTVSVPLNGSKNDALAICGSKSGRDIDKYQAAGLTLAKGKEVKVPVVADCDIYYECKILYKTDILKEGLPEEIIDKAYPKGDFHRLYFGEIVACYTK